MVFEKEFGYVFSLLNSDCIRKLEQYQSCTLLLSWSQMTNLPLSIVVSLKICFNKKHTQSERQ